MAEQSIMPRRPVNEDDVVQLGNQILELERKISVQGSVLGRRLEAYNKEVIRRLKLEAELEELQDLKPKVALESALGQALQEHGLYYVGDGPTRFIEGWNAAHEKIKEVYKRND